MTMDQVEIILGTLCGAFAFLTFMVAKSTIDLSTRIDNVERHIDEVKQ